MRRVLILLSALAVAACGADGEPITPTANSSVTLSNNGVRIGTNVGLGKGPFKLNLGLGL